MKAGDTLGGKYKLIERLGRGAMGVVWEAVNERTGRRVALKLIDRPTEDLRVRLLREARACGSLNHPNIVEVYDVGETDEDDPFLVMQLLSGETLAELLERKKRIEPYTLAARICRDIAGALDAAHSAQIIHRDLKPANIFLHREVGADEGSFTVKVLDFGVSKSLAGTDGPATVTGLVVGSPAYMSPEQVAIVKGLDPRTDIWSLGIILYELLTGSRPFSGRTTEEVVQQILSAPIPPVSNRVRSVPPSLDDLVARCLERDRDKRFQDARSLARALASFAEVSNVSRVVVNAVPPPSSSPGRSAMGSTPDASQAIAGRLAMGANPEGNPPSGPGRGMASSSPAHEDESLAATLLMPRGGAPGFANTPPVGMAAVVGTQVVPGGGHAATQILSPTDPIESAMPAWRLEMQQALEASRKAGETQGVSQAEQPQQGGTMALAPEMIPGYATAVAQAPGVITTTAPITQPSAAGGMPGAPASEAASQKRSRGVGAWVYAVVGVGVVSVVALVAIVALGGSSEKEKSEGAAATATSGEQVAVPVPKETAMAAPPEVATAAPAAPSVAEAAPKMTAAVPREPPAKPTAAPTPPRATSGAVIGAPLSTSGKQPGAPSVKGPLPKCTRFVKTNCTETRSGIERKAPF